MSGALTRTVEIANQRGLLPGTVIAVRPVGVLKMQDEAGGDEKIIAVPSRHLTKRYDRVENYTDLPEIMGPDGLEPAFAAAIALSAISRGLRGTCGLRSCVPPDPVTAQVMKTSRFMASGMVILPLRGKD